MRSPGTSRANSGQGRVIGIDRFGASGEGAEVLAHFGFTAEHVGREAGELLKSAG